MLSYINTFFCLVAIIMCSCRLGTKMSKETTKPIIRFQYVMWLGLAMFLLIVRPLDYTHIVMSGALLLHMLITFPAWRSGQPKHAIKDGPCSASMTT
jgi:hypothetical protein